MVLTRVDARTWIAPSRSCPGTPRTLTKRGNRWFCDCPAGEKVAQLRETPERACGHLRELRVALVVEALAA